MANVLDAINALGDMPTLDEIRAELARRSYLDFVKFMWQRNDNFIVGRHTEAITTALDKAIDHYRNGQSTWMCLEVPYRHGKSDLGSRYFPPYFLGHFPHAEVMDVGYGTDLVYPFSRFARQVVRDPRYQMVFPGVRLIRGNAAVSEWGVQAPDGRTLGITHWIGIQGGATGKGANLVVCDDLFKGRETAESDTVRNKIWEGLTNNIMTRLAPVTICVILATPWHIDDQFGRIQRRMNEDPHFPKFEFLVFPAFGDRANREYKYLFPERFSPEWYNAQEALLGPYAAAGLLQCDPIARGGNVLQTERIKFYEHLPENVPLARGWDLASTAKERVKEHPDWTVGAKVGVELLPSAIEGEAIPVIYIEDVTDGQWNAPERDAIIKGTAMSDGRIAVGVESFGTQKDTVGLLARALHGLRQVRGVRMPGDKLMRGQILETAMAAGNVYMRKAPWNDRVIKQLQQIPNSPNDDIYDAINVAIHIHAPNETRVWPRADTLLAKKFVVAWDKADVDVRSMHYGAIWMGEDLAVYVLCALWDHTKGRLMVYDGFSVEPEHDRVAKEIAAHMHLRKYRATGIYCNESLNPEPPAVSMMRQVNASLSKQKIKASIQVSTRYDELGAIMRVRNLIETDMLYVHPLANDALSSWAQWTVRTGHPSGEHAGYCRALCLIASEVIKVEKARPVKRMPDYRKVQTRKAVA